VDVIWEVAVEKYGVVPCFSAFFFVCVLSVQDWLKITPFCYIALYQLLSNTNWAYSIGLTWLHQSERSTCFTKISPESPPVCSETQFNVLLMGLFL
jgi:hypothetical protein